MKYRIYIDEVGNPDLRSSDNPNHRFLSLTGVIVELEYTASVLHKEMEALKIKFFGAHPDEPVVFHRKELMKAKPPFGALKDQRVRVAFDNKLLAHLSDWEYSVISVCLDKKRHRETYATWRYDPYHYCRRCCWSATFSSWSTIMHREIRWPSPEAVRRTED